MNRTTIATMSAGCLMLASGSADAFHLGDLRVVSRTGEPLKAYVQLWSDGSGARGPVAATIAPDNDYAANAPLARLSADLEARYVTDSSGAGYIEITGQSPYSEPLLAIRLRVAQGATARIRHYAAALAPPARAAAGRRRGPAPVPSPRLAAATTYTVAPGDTLWRIARAIDGAAENVMEAIVAANPRAFVNGDPDRLIAGAELRLPGAAAPVVAPAAVAATAPAVVPATASVASPPSSTASAGPPAAAVDWRERYPDTAAEVARLAEKFASIRARYGITEETGEGTVTDTVDIAPSLPAAAPQSEIALESGSVSADGAPIADTSAAPDREAAAPVDAVVDDAAGQLDAAAATPKAVAAEVADTADAAASRTAPAPRADATAGPRLPGLVPIAATAIVILLLGLAVTPLLRRKRSLRAEIVHRADEETRKAAVSRKAEHRVQLETEMRKTIGNRVADDRRQWESHVLDITGDHDLDELIDYDAPSTIERADDGNHGAATIDLSRETQDLRELLAMQDDISIESTGEFDVDSAIAHGRYDEAETRLQEVIAANPKNHDARLRLAEVYYITERVDDFVALADALYRNHRNDMNDAEWQRVMRMGKIIAPDRPPFCGPRSVHASNAADAVS